MGGRAGGGTDVATDGWKDGLGRMIICLDSSNHTSRAFHFVRFPCSCFTDARYADLIPFSDLFNHVYDVCFHSCPFIFYLDIRFLTYFAHLVCATSVLFFH